MSIGCVAAGVLEQGSESDFCFGKEDSGPRPEWLLCPVQTRIGSETCRQALLGHGRGWQQRHANGLEFPSSAWVSQLPTPLAGQRQWWRGLAHRAGSEKEPTSRFLPLDIHPHAVRRGLSGQREAWPGEGEPACLQWAGAVGETQAAGMGNLGEDACCKARGTPGILIGPSSWNRVSHRYYGMYRIFRASQEVLVVKSLPANAKDMRRRFDPWVGNVPWRRKWQAHSSILAWRLNPMDRGAWWATINRVAKSQTRLEEIEHACTHRIFRTGRLGGGWWAEGFVIGWNLTLHLPRAPPPSRALGCTLHLCQAHVILR